MEKVTSETIKANFPGVWWEIYKTGYREAQENPQLQEKMANQHLARTLAKPEPPAPAQPSLPTQPVAISAEQGEINKQLGLSAEEFTKYSHVAPTQLDPVQAEINGKLGLSEETFLKYAR